MASVIVDTNNPYPVILVKRTGKNYNKIVGVFTLKESQPCVDLFY